MRMHVFVGMISLALLAEPGTVRAETIIGRVAELSNPEMRFKNAGTAWRQAADRGREKIADTCEIETTDSGEALFLWEDERFEKLTRLQLQGGSRLTIDPEAEKLVLRLHQGAFQWAGLRRVQAFARNAKAWTVGTAFVMRYDAATDCTEVLGIEHQAFVENVFVAGVVETVEHKDLVVVCGRQPPRKRRLTDEEYDAYLRPYELPGSGSATSQTAHDAQLLGASIPEPDRAPGAPPGGPPRDETGERLPDFDQPLPAAGSTDLGIDF